MEEKIKHAWNIQTVLPNGWTLSISYMEKTEDGSVDDREFWATEAEIKTTHAAIEAIIKDFRCPVAGDVVDDGVEMQVVHEVWFGVSNGRKTLHIELK